MVAVGWASGPNVTYTMAGSADDAVILIEERRMPTPRQLVVVCHPDRVPVCIRMLPTSAPSNSTQAAWVRSNALPPASRPPDASAGRLRFDADPWCVVTVDGAPLGETPIHDQELAGGPHDLLCSNPVLGIERRVTVQIEPGRVTQARIRLQGAEPDEAALEPEPAGRPGIPGIRAWPRGAGNAEAPSAPAP
jgi:hypothetical protein